jgi:hypothetical protein
MHPRDLKSVILYDEWEEYQFFLENRYFLAFDVRVVPSIDIPEGQIIFVRSTPKPIRVKPKLNSEHLLS